VRFQITLAGAEIAGEIAAHAHRRGAAEHGAPENALTADTRADGDVDVGQAHAAVAADIMKGQRGLADAERAERTQGVERVADRIGRAAPLHDAETPFGIAFGIDVEADDAQFVPRHVALERRIEIEDQFGPFEGELRMPGVAADAQVADAEDRPARLPFAIERRKRHRPLQSLGQEDLHLLGMGQHPGEQQAQPAHHGRPRNDQQTADPEQDAAADATTAGALGIHPRRSIHAGRRPSITSRPRRTVPASTALRAGSGWSCR
jgi:hypothetical protein